MEKTITLCGPVEKIDGKLMLIIPLDSGGDELALSSQGISEIHGKYLHILIPDWLADKLKINEGSLVHVNNENGKLNISPVNPISIQ